MEFIKRMLISTLAILIASYILPGINIHASTIAGVAVNSVVTTIIVAVVLAFLNSVVKPIMIILTIPVTLITFGLFLVVINALLILMTARLVDGFIVDGFWWAFLFSLLLSMITSLLNAFTRQPQKEEE